MLVQKMNDILFHSMQTMPRCSLASALYFSFSLKFNDSTLLTSQPVVKTEGTLIGKGEGQRIKNVVNEVTKR